jgi:hypothetical protein
MMIRSITIICGFLFSPLFVYSFTRNTQWYKTTQFVRTPYKYIPQQHCNDDNVVTNWNDGEVPWIENRGDVFKNTNIITKEVKEPNATNSTLILIQSPLKPKLYTVVSGIFKEIYKDVFHIDTMLSQLQNLDFNRIITHNVDINFDLYCILLAFGMFEKYKPVSLNYVRQITYISKKTRRKIKRIITASLLLLAAIFTKNVKCVY